MNAVGIESDEEFVNEMPDFDTLFSIVVDKIKQFSPSINFIEDKRQNTDETDKLQLNKDLENKIKNTEEKLENKEKELNIISKQKENLRSQLDYAVKISNARDFELSKNRNPE